MLHIPPTKILSSPNRSKNKTKTRATQTSLPFGKWRFREKEVRRMGKVQKGIRQKEQQDYWQNNKRGDIEKWDQTGSPEILDRGETS